MAEVLGTLRPAVARGRVDLLRMPPGVVTATGAAALGLVASFWFWFTVDDFGDSGLIYMGMGLLAMIGVPLFWMATRPVRLGERLPSWPGFQLDGAGDDILLGVGLGVMFMLLAGVGRATGSATAVIPLPPFASQFAGDSRFIAVVLLAPVLEEVFFRGWLYGMLVNGFRRGRGARVEGVISGAEIGAALISGVVFSLFHVAAYGTALGTAFFTVGLFGVSAAVLNARGGRLGGEGSLWAGWVAHTIYNGAIYTLVFGVGVQVG